MLVKFWTYIWEFPWWATLFKRTQTKPEPQCEKCFWWKRLLERHIGKVNSIWLRTTLQATIQSLKVINCPSNLSKGFFDGQPCYNYVPLYLNPCTQCEEYIDLSEILENHIGSNRTKSQSNQLIKRIFLMDSLVRTNISLNHSHPRTYSDDW